jgi:hypothetical protein
MGTQAFLLEILLAGFFAVACLRARAGSFHSLDLAPRRLFAMTDRIERLRRSRWQWFAMVLLLYVLRAEQGVPMLAELTAAAQFVVFLALPTQKPAPEVLSRS